MSFIKLLPIKFYVLFYFYCCLCLLLCFVVVCGLDHWLRSAAATSTGPLYAPVSLIMALNFGVRSTSKLDNVT